MKIWIRREPRELIFTRCLQVVNSHLFPAKTRCRLWVLVLAQCYFLLLLRLMPAWLCSLWCLVWNEPAQVSDLARYWISFLQRPATWPVFITVRIALKFSRWAFVNISCPRSDEHVDYIVCLISNRVTVTSTLASIIIRSYSFAI